MRATNRLPAKNGSAEPHAVAKAGSTRRAANGEPRPPEANGEPAARANGAARKRSHVRPVPADGPAGDASVVPPELAGFGPANIQPIDAEMWPIQPVMWLQQEWTPGPPASSDLRIERHHRVPVPGFLNLDAGRGYRLDDLEAARERQWSSAPGALPPELPPALPPIVRLTPPQSGLTLLGWDPRAVVPSAQESRPAEASRLSGASAGADRFPPEGKK
jgi:hypothetical protein